MKRLVLLLIAAVSLGACDHLGKFGNGGPPDPGAPPRPAGDPGR